MLGNRYKDMPSDNQREKSPPLEVLAGDNYIFLVGVSGNPKESLPFVHSFLTQRRLYGLKVSSGP